MEDLYSNFWNAVLAHDGRLASGCY